MKKTIKKGASEMLAVIVFVVLIGTVALVVMSTQKNKVVEMNSAVQEEAWLLSGKK